MAGNALVNYTRTTSGYAAVRMALSRMAAGTGTGATDFLGSSAADAAAELATIFNDTSRRFVNDNPLWSRITRTATMTAGTRTLAIPTDLRDLDIMSIEYGTGDERVGQRIRMIPQHEMLVRGWDWLSSNNTADWPEFFALHPEDNAAGGSVNFFPMPNTTRALILTMRVAEAAFTGAELMDSASTKICEVPDAMVPTFAYLLATEFALINWGPNDPRVEALRAEADRRNRYWINRMAGGIPAEAVAANQEAQGQATGWGNLAASGFGRRGRGYGGYGY